jgi:hypothetical protein
MADERGDTLRVAFSADTTALDELVTGRFGLLIILAVAWSLIWKGLALWRAARRGDMWWFVAFLVIHTLGLLEIIYIFGVTKAKLSHFVTERRFRVWGT